RLRARVPLDHFVCLRRTFGRHVSSFEDRSPTKDGTQGIAQFMRNHRQEFVFGTISLFRSASGLAFCFSRESTLSNIQTDPDQAVRLFTVYEQPPAAFYPSNQAVFSYNSVLDVMVSPLIDGFADCANNAITVLRVDFIAKCFEGARESPRFKSVNLL